ncbi:hypothetical protein D9611_002910 [Ephemerocybe angulata]|uniref:Uncharacterized protein n=1 Tax=Ephemerocybe angulata TaxID=980116 RepID=A0A8H5C954_9AGAR|nr:hypothetical protein D9611_002910 [Tulosesus angulatus]
MQELTEVEAAAERAADGHEALCTLDAGCDCEEYRRRIPQSIPSPLNEGPMHPKNADPSPAPTPAKVAVSAYRRWWKTQDKFFLKICRMIEQIHGGAYPNDHGQAFPETDPVGRTTLMHACYQGNVDAGNVLLLCPSVDQSILDHKDRSALWHAIRAIGRHAYLPSEKSSYEGIELLLRRSQWTVSMIRKVLIGRDGHVWAMDLLGVAVHESPLKGLFDPELSPMTFSAFNWFIEDTDTIILLAFAHRFRKYTDTPHSMFTRILINCWVIPKPPWFL